MLRRERRCDHGLGRWDFLGLVGAAVGFRALTQLYRMRWADTGFQGPWPA